MAIIQGIISLGSSEIIKTDTNPTLGGGVSAPLNSLCIAGDGSGIFLKSGAGNAAWTLVTGGGGPPAPTPTPPKIAKLATTVALPSVVAAGSGIGKTLTRTAVGILTVDGVATVLNDLILVKNQALLKDNGLYKVTIEGTAGVAAVLTRDTTFDESNANEVFTGALIDVTQGTVNAGKTFKLIAINPIIVDTNELVFQDTRLIINYPIQTGLQVNIAPNLTRFISPLSGAIATTESAAQLLVNAGIILEVKVKVVGNNTSANTIVTLVKNGVDTANIITIGAGLSGIFKSNVPVLLEEDASISYKIVVPNAVSGINIYPIITNIGS